MVFRIVKTALLIAFALANASFVSGPGAQAQTHKTPLQIKAPFVATQIVSEAAKGPVRIIVEVKPATTPGYATLGTAHENMPAILSDNLAVEDAVITAHFGSPASSIESSKSLVHTDVLPYFGITATLPEIESLASDDRVVSIDLNVELRPNLIQSVPLINAPAGYKSYGATGSHWAVAVLDTGVQSNHLFIAPGVIAEACFSSPVSQSFCPNGLTAQYGKGSGINCDISVNGCEHGTHVAGIAAGFNHELKAQQPINGVAEFADIFSIQTYHKSSDAVQCKPAPTCATTSVLDIQRALQYVYSVRDKLSGGVRIAAVNISAGDDSHPYPAGGCDNAPGASSLKPIIDKLSAVTIPTIIAAGNAHSTTGIDFPACITTAIAVAATDKTKGAPAIRAPYSNYSSDVALFAPGSGTPDAAHPLTMILSSVPKNFNCFYVYGCVNYTGPAPTLPSGSYAYLSGTSMAAPHVAGAWAAIKTVFAAAKVQDVLTALQVTGIPVANVPAKVRIDIAAALVNLKAKPNTLNVTPQQGTITSGVQGGPFNPHSFTYQVSTNGGSAPFQITNVPAWLTASRNSGTATTTPTAVTFTVNQSANSLAVGVQGPTLFNFVNTNDHQGDQPRTAQITVKAIAPPANDNFVNAAALKLGQVTSATNVGATKETGEPNHAGDAGGHSVWWSVTPAVTEQIVISTAGSNFDTLLAVYSGNAVNSVSLAQSNDDTPFGDGTSLLTFIATAGTTYHIAIDGKNGATGNISMIAAASDLTLAIVPATGMSALGVKGGSFAPATFSYTLQTYNGTAAFQIVNLPSWLSASPSSGTASMTPTTITFTVNANAKSLATGNYTAAISVNSSTATDKASQVRVASLTVKATDASPSFQAVGYIPSPPPYAPYSQANGVSADGKVVVGATSDVTGDQLAFRFTNGVLTPLPELATPGNSEAIATNLDGSVIVGDSNGEAFRWTASTGTVALGLLSGSSESVAAAVSSDGSIIVGSQYGPLMPLVWVNNNVSALPSCSTTNFSRPQAMSADGKVIAGYGHCAQGGEQALMWTGGSVQPLGFLPGGTVSVAYGLSANGKVVVGESFSGPLPPNDQPFLWTNGGMTALGVLPGNTNGHALAANADGSVIVGVSSIPNRSFFLPIWPSGGFCLHMSREGCKYVAM